MLHVTFVINIFNTVCASYYMVRKKCPCWWSRVSLCQNILRWANKNWLETNQSIHSAKKTWHKRLRILHRFYKIMTLTVFLYRMTERVKWSLDFCWTKVKNHKRVPIFIGFLNNKNIMMGERENLTQDF